MQEKREMKNREVNIDTILFSEIYGLWRSTTDEDYLVILKA